MPTKKQTRAILRQELERNNKVLREARTEDLLINRFNLREDVRVLFEKGIKIDSSKIDETYYNDIEEKENNKKSFKNRLKSLITHKYFSYGKWIIGCGYVCVLMWNLVMPELKISIDIIKVVWDFVNVFN